MQYENKTVEIVRRENLFRYENLKIFGRLNSPIAIRPEDTSNIA
jgi:hypothetical protein